MKTRSLQTTFIAALAMLGLAFAMVPTTAEAGHDRSSRYSHRCGSCGSPIYERLAIVGYTHCGDPIYRWVTVTHHCSHHSYGPSYYRSPHVEPEDVIAGIVFGILSAHHHSSSHYSHGCR